MKSSDSAISNQKIYKFIETVPAVVWECSIDPDSQCPVLTYISKNVKKMLGYSPEECLLDKEFHFKIIHDEDKDFVKERFTQIITSKETGVLEFRWESEDRKTIWTETHCSVILDEFGNHKGIRAFSFDISKRKNAEIEITTRVRQHEAIALLGRKALEGITPDKLMNDAVVLVQNVLNCEYVKILELLQKENLFILKAAAGWEKGLIGNAQAGIAEISEEGYTLMMNDPVIVDDIRLEKRFRKQALLYDKDVKSGMSVVIRGKGNPFGVISVHTTHLRSFTGDDSHFLRAIANIIAVSLERKKTETELQNSVKEKEILLKEIHHRVKNNLQVISSLLSLQAKSIKDKESLEMFNESQNRIKSMALIHEKLYQSRNLFKINLEEYVTDLVKNLFDSYSQKVTPIIHIKNIFISIDMAVAIGLIINELASNALKHAFKAEDLRNVPGELIISMTNDKNNYVLVVKDNGSGFPDEIDYRYTSTLGLQLVLTLVEQLDGKIELTNKGGAEFCIRFSSNR